MLRVFPAFHTDTLEWVREGDTVPLEATDPIRGGGCVFFLLEQTNSVF